LIRSAGVFQSWGGAIFDVSTSGGEPMDGDEVVAGYYRVSVARDDMRSPELYEEEITRYCTYKALVLGPDLQRRRLLGLPRRQTAALSRGAGRRS
jgi:hypothetical protein